jgi:uncharacterized membrane protein
MTPRSVPRALAPVTLALCVAGAAVAIYLTLVHYTSSVSLACTATGVINCEKVTTSPQSIFVGLPVALWGVVFFVVAAALCLPAAWRTDAPAVRVGRLAWIFAGGLMVLRLLYAELFQIDAICLWCTAVHVITVALFIAVVVGEALTSQTPVTTA